MGDLKSYEALYDESMPDEKDVLYYSYKKDGSSYVCDVKCNYVAKWFVEHGHFVLTSAFGTGDAIVYGYDEKAGVYYALTDDNLKVIVRRFLEYYSENMTRTSKIIEVVNLMKLSMNHISINDFNNDLNIINFKNGILKLDTLELVPHSPEFLCSVQIPVNWNSEFVTNPRKAKSKVFDKFLCDLTALKESKDAENTKKLILEFIGVTLSNIPGYKFKKALLTFGKGNSGKTQLRNFAIALVGENNTATVELDALETREGPSQAFGKRIIGAGDMKYGTASQIATFKNITGGDNITIRFLYKEGFSGKIDGVFWYGANTLPLFGGDRGSWVYERFIPVRCDNVIPPEKRDPDLLNKMLLESDAIVFKAVLAMRDAVNRGYKFTIPESSKEDLKLYQSENDIVIEFFDNYCYTEYDEYVGDEIKTVPVFVSLHTQKEIRRAFSNWAKANYNVVPNKKEFETSVAQILGCKVSELYYRDASSRNYLKFDITPECEEEWIYDF